MVAKPEIGLLKLVRVQHDTCLTIKRLKV